jgi:hypothetical protein
MNKVQRKLINKNFRIVLEPKRKSVGAFVIRRRFGVGAGALEKWTSPETALKAFASALVSKTDKYTFRHRTYGRIDFYSK